MPPTSRSSALRNFSPGSGVRPSTVIGVHANAWLKGSEVTPPAAFAPGKCSIRSQSCRYVFKVVCRSEEHTSELQSRLHLVCRLLLEKNKNHKNHTTTY